MKKEISLSEEFEEKFGNIFSLSGDDGVHYGTISGHPTYFIKENEEIIKFIKQKINQRVRKIKKQYE